MAFDIGQLKIYGLSRKLSSISWKIYLSLDWKNKKILGDQFVEATDSIGANLAEGYGRFHYLDRIKFFYNARGSLLESKHWLDLLDERELIEVKELKIAFISIVDNLFPQLNSFINSIYKIRNNLKNSSPPNT